MADLTGTILKLNRAAFHLDNLEKAVKSFSESKPYTFFVEPNPNPPDFVMRVRFSHCLPLGCGLVAGDFVHNIRSGLDHLIYQVSTLPAEHNGRTKLCFPLCKEKSEYVKSKGNWLQGVGELERKMIDEFQPFNASGQEADDALVLLRKISNFDKHRSIAVVTESSILGKMIPKSGAFCGMEFSGDADFSFVRGGAEHHYKAVGDGSLIEDGQVIAKIRTPFDVCLEPIVHTVIRFGHGDPDIEGRFVFPTLASIYNRAREIVERFRTHYGGPEDRSHEGSPGEASGPGAKLGPRR